jgi:uncharacterized repeat protein (TIGR01451 family)
MRKWYYVAGLAILGLAGLAGWATLGSAQPVYGPPAASPPRAKPIDPIQLPAEPIKIPDVIGSQPSGLNRSPIRQPTGDAKAPVIVEPIDAPMEPGRLIPPLKDADAPVKIIQPSTPPSAVERPMIVGELASNSRQEPAVSLEWIGPTAVKVGMPADYTLAVRNICNIPVQKVIVQVRVPGGVNVVSTDPKAEGADSILVWELGTLLARQDRRLSLKLMSAKRGDMTCQAWVTFTGSALMKMRVREPKILVKAQVPDKVLVGDPANLVLTISNPGDHPAEKVKITAMLAEGLESIRGNKLTYDLGTLSAGETRTVTVPCVSKNVGKQKCDVFAEAEGGLKAGDNVAINVIQPRLDLAVAGPKMRYLDKKATYTLKVTNPGDAPASNVFITDMIPQGFKFLRADNGGQHDEATRSVKWFLGELGAGQTREVKIELLAEMQGEFSHKVLAHAARGMKAEQELKTIVEGLSAIQMELVDTEDPVEVGSETSYEIKVTNTGSKAETDVRLVCVVPLQLKLKGVQGPVKYDVVGNEIIFQPLGRLAPKADVVYRITVTAVQKGDARFKASLTSAGLVEPVVKVEPTKVYAE